MNAGAGQMQDVVQDLENQLIRIGIPKEERTFAAHITLGRTRSIANLKELTRALISLKDQPGRHQLSFRVQTLTLFKSTLTPHGPIYEIVQESILKTT
jgi:2'-5' RNA ligase